MKLPPACGDQSARAIAVHAAAKDGIRTIINLRGPRDDGGWQLEAEARAANGITLLDFTARSRAAPDKAMLHARASCLPKQSFPQ